MEMYFKHLSCDGIRELYETKQEPLKFMFWVVTMSVMMSGTGYFAFRIVTRYNVAPTTTTYSTVPKTPLSIPKIVVCFNGGLNGTALTEANFSKDLMLALSGALTLGTMEISSMNKSKREFDNFLTFNKIDILQFYQRFGYDCEDIVEIVYLAGVGRQFDNVACKNVSRLLSPFYGVCFLYINNGFQTRPGLMEGIRMYLKSPPDSLASLYPNIALRADRSQSFVIMIDSNFFILPEKTFLVPISVKTEISLDIKHFIRLPESNSSCIKQEFFSSDNCFNRCFGDVFYEFCGCYPFRYYNSEVDKLKKICNVFEEQSCPTYNPKLNFDCQQYCIPICDEWIYDVTITYAPSATESQQSASLWIGYESMQITKVLLV